MMTKTSKYQRWIKEFATGDVANQCAEFTKLMNDVYPELRRVCGFYHCPIVGKRPHWWLIDQNGNIVDPTAVQFPSRGVMGEYIELEGPQGKPKGRCLNCGEVSYHETYFCSDGCRDEYMSNFPAR